MIPALILAAGQSTRMGQPKMLLPWGATTIIERVIAVYRQAGAQEVLVVTGGAREPVEALVEQQKARSVYNRAYATQEMLGSIQCGLRVLAEEAYGAALIGLGDQPQIEAGSVRLVLEAYARTKSPLVVPSFQMRRGHPWLVARELWPELLAMHAEETPRDFLNRHAREIFYVTIETPDILADLDTPEEYDRARPVNP